MNTVWRRKPDPAIEKLHAELTELRERIVALETKHGGLDSATDEMDKRLTGQIEDLRKSFQGYVALEEEHKEAEFTAAPGKESFTRRRARNRAAHFNQEEFEKNVTTKKEAPKKE